MGVLQAREHFQIVQSQFSHEHLPAQFYPGAAGHGLEAKMGISVDLRLTAVLPLGLEWPPEPQSLCQTLRVACIVGISTLVLFRALILLPIMVISLPVA